MALCLSANLLRHVSAGSACKGIAISRTIAASDFDPDPDHVIQIT